MSWAKSVLFFLILAALFASGLAVRRAVLAAQYECYGRPLPFNLESALNFRYVRMLAATNGLPVVDQSVQYPGGVAVRQTYEIGSERICAFLARLFPESVPLDERVRWISALWFCLGIPAMFLWIWWRQKSLWGAALAGAFYALSLASVIRSTGQEISHENFALPLLIAHFALSALAAGEGKRLPVFICLAAASAVLLACALMLWDLIQFYIIVWVLLGFVRVVRGDYFRPVRRRWQWGLNLAALVLAGLLNPYLRAHGFVWSPAMLLAYGVLPAMFLTPGPWLRRVHGSPGLASAKRSGGAGRFALPTQNMTGIGRADEYEVFVGAEPLFGERQRSSHRDATPTRQNHGEKSHCSLHPNSKQWIVMFLRAALVLLPVLIGFWLGRQYLQSYHHFTELLWAKIIFLNAKPSDPSLLTFSQRILWVPALNSATFSLTKTLFPFSLPLFLVSAGIFLFCPGRTFDPEIQKPASKSHNSLFDCLRRVDPETTGLLFFTFISLMAYILFVRMHVFAAVGLAASAGLLGAWIVRRQTWFRVPAVALLLAGALAEGGNVLRAPARWGGSQSYLKQRRELVDWLKTNAPGQPLLANFGISAFALAYADSPIVLHPKFESPDIRKRVQEYGEMLFKADEEKFRLWAVKHGAAFYVHSLGEFAGLRPEAQMRYFVDALNPPAAAPARLFEFNPSALRWFVPLWGNLKYRVFRIITPDDEQFAEFKAGESFRKIKAGLLSEAGLAAEHALLYDPGSKNAQEAVLRVNELKKKEPEVRTQ